MPHVVRVISLADGTPTPHDNRFVVGWNPHTEFGTCEIDTTDDIEKAREFDLTEVMAEWKTISKVQRFRPDGEPNRPLTGLTIEIVKKESKAARF